VIIYFLVIFDFRVSNRNRLVSEEMGRRPGEKENGGKDRIGKKEDPR
jgi:hypothetical protein